MRAAFPQAAIPEPFRVLGRNLKPFSLGHCLLFERLEINTKQPDMSDLLPAVWLCSFNHDSAADSLSDPHLSKELKRWVKQCGKFDHTEAIQFFKRYIDESTKEPDFWIQKQSDKPGSAHWIQTVVVVLMREFGFTQDEALSLPYALAISHWLQYLEAHGIIRLFTEDDYKVMETIKRMDAQNKGGN